MTQKEIIQKETTKSYLLRNIPTTLWVQVKHKAIDKGVSVRQLILDLLAADLHP